MCSNDLIMSAVPGLFGFPSRFHFCGGDLQCHMSPIHNQSVTDFCNIVDRDVKVKIVNKTWNNPQNPGRFAMCETFAGIPCVMSYKN